MQLQIKRFAIIGRPLISRKFQTLVIPIGLILFLILVGILFYWGKIPKIDWQYLLGKLAFERAAEEKKEATEVPEKLTITEETLKPAGKIYEETAQPGEGITHLARRALKEYLEEKGKDLNLTPEHKIYIEDYLKDRTGERWLKLGETLTFSEELIKEAINKSLQLNPDQLENLKQYSQLVSEF